MSYDELIMQLNTFRTNKEKIDYLMNFFIENVEYDYVTLEKAKIKYSLLDEIDEKFDCSNPEEVQQALIHMKQECGFSDELIKRLSQFYGKDRIIPAKPERVMFGKVYKAEPERVIQNSLTHAFNLSKNSCEFKDGVLIKGVCADFAQFIDGICKQLNISSEIVNGTTTVGHVWNIIEGKHYDITYAIFVRDGYSGWEKTNINDWLGVEEEDLLKLQPYRSIDKKPLTVED